MAEARIEGLAELRLKLLSLGAEIASKNGGPVRSALAKGTKRVRDIARALAPVETGRLQRAIYASRDKNPAAEGLTESFSVGVKDGKSRDDLRGAYYWRFIEFFNQKQAAQPFLRPAFDQGVQSFQTEFVTDLTKAIESAVRRGARRG